MLDCAVAGNLAAAARALGVPAGRRGGRRSVRHMHACHPSLEVGGSSALHIHAGSTSQGEREGRF